MMASQGRISEAAQYAQKAQEKGDSSDIIPALIAAEKFFACHVSNFFIIFRLHTYCYR